MMHDEDGDTFSITEKKGGITESNLKEVQIIGNRYLTLP